jgi:hypothetical protein
MHAGGAKLCPISELSLPRREPAFLFLFRELNNQPIPSQNESETALKRVSGDVYAFMPTEKHALIVVCTLKKTPKTLTNGPNGSKNLPISIYLTSLLHIFGPWLASTAPLFTSASKT